MVSKIFEKVISNYIGLQIVILVLPPVLYMCLTSEYLNLSGYISDSNEELYKLLSGLPISYAQYLIILLKMLSYPEEFLSLEDCIMFIISTSVTGIIFITVVLSK